MEQIINYLDNIFETLPKSKQILDLKEDLLSDMEDKYNELKRSGKSEHEAISIVISNFGNVDELIREFDITLEDERIELPALTVADVSDYLKVYKKASNFMGIGIVLCMLGASLLILIYQLIDDGFISGLSESASNIVGLIPLFLLVAIAAGMFIYAVIIINRYKDLQYSFTLPTPVRKHIENKNDLFQISFTRSAIISIVMCILSPLSILISSVINDYAISYGIVALLLIISVSVYIFIYYGGIKLSYNTLLKVDAYEKRTNKVISAVAAIVFPLAVIIFLTSGFVFHQWLINWIVFPITGILFGMFTEAYKIIKEKR